MFDFEALHFWSGIFIGYMEGKELYTIFFLCVEQTNTFECHMILKMPKLVLGCLEVLLAKDKMEGPANEKKWNRISFSTCGIQTAKFQNGGSSESGCTEADCKKIVGQVFKWPLKEMGCYLQNTDNRHAFLLALGTGHEWGGLVKPLYKDFVGNVSRLACMGRFSHVF